MRLIEHQVGNSPVFGSAAFMQAAVCIVVLLLLEDGLAQVGEGFRAGLQLGHRFRYSFLWRFASQETTVCLLLL